MKKILYIILGVLNVALIASFSFMYINKTSIEKKLKNEEKTNSSLVSEISKKKEEVNLKENDYNTLKDANQDKLDLLEGFKTWKNEIEEKM